jgi:sec-independent protein translocase protein TatA
MLGFINGLSPYHVLLVLIVALLLFGNRLPEVARSIGKAINEFKRGMRETNDDADRDSVTGSKDPEKLKPGVTNTVQRESSGQRDRSDAEKEEVGSGKE